MDEHPQDSNTPVTGAQTTDKQEAPAVKVLKYVQVCIAQTDSVAEQRRCRRFTTDLLDQVR